MWAHTCTRCSMLKHLDLQCVGSDKAELVRARAPPAPAVVRNTKGLAAVARGGMRPPTMARARVGPYCVIDVISCEWLGTRICVVEFPGAEFCGQVPGTSGAAQPLCTIRFMSASLVCKCTALQPRVRCPGRWRMIFYLVADARDVPAWCT